MPFTCDTSIHNRIVLRRKKEQITKAATKWIHLTNIMLNERRQTQKNTCCLIPLISVLIEIRSVVAPGDRDWLGRDTVDREGHFLRCWLMSYILIRAWVTWMYVFIKANQTVKLRSMHFTICESYPDKKFLGQNQNSISYCIF